MLGNKLKSLIALLKVLPVSLGDCERRFSQLNVYQTSGRDKLTSVNDLLMIGINGPSLELWNFEKFGIGWLKSGKHMEPGQSYRLAKDR